MSETPECPHCRQLRDRLLETRQKLQNAERYALALERLLLSAGWIVTADGWVRLESDDDDD